MTGPVIEPDGSPSPTPSQVQHPWRATIRTVFQLIVGLATMLPILVGLLHLPSSAGLAAALGVAAAFTRIMADPRVEAALRQWLPWLAAEPNGN
ncbi:hypothetical protein [Nocardia wallacei]|uniref:hypothetical protein n=1 Tax=Nocardia wallacei TaxID=480035 RepID=UPI002455990F|nr:hypothetical protein [Nocardia wallacei]